MVKRRVFENRHAFTLMELMLALSLVVVAAALIGSLMQMYARNFATRGEDIRRIQLARSILNMIAEDLRSVVTAQEYDASVLEQQMGGAAGGGAASGGAGSGGAAGGGTGAGAGAAGSAAIGGASGAGQPASSASASGGTDAAASGDPAAAQAFIRPPGIYGSQYDLTLDVSRLPRPDEYFPAPGAISSPTLTDVPGDIKNVSYFIQTPNAMGVQDTLEAFNDGAIATSGMSSGLVRRQLDRAILAYAEEMADASRLMRTGELIAPEVVSLEFAYFDGVQWTYTWDSSTQALPWLVQITLGIQFATGEAKAELESGVSLSSLTYDQRAEYGIQVYELIVAIPGANLKAAPTDTTDVDSGMSSMGL
ncbi:MAG: prepilin-type N-terminal cleavage/methylation domain-containing protein [Pirellulaceae bacterium]|nr:prepilin-type N-terminal cleavage/methylation domain-containing protein [Pirellulaceae bacterium]